MFSENDRVILKSGGNRRWKWSCVTGLLIGLVAVFALPQFSCGQTLDRSIQPADTLSPRETLQSFLDSCNELHDLILADRYYDRNSGRHIPLAMRILDCLDTSEIPEYERMSAASEAAICLKEILDRVELPGFDQVPDAGSIESLSESERLSQWRIPGTRITIARMQEGPRRHEFLFTPGTIENAVRYYESMKSLPYRQSGPRTSPGFYEWYVSAPGNPVVARLVDYLPRWCRQRLLGQAFWKWMGLLLSAVLGVLLMLGSYRMQLRLVARYRSQSLWRYCLTIVFAIVAMLIPWGVLMVANDYLTVRGGPLYYTSFVSNMAALLAALPLVFGTGNRVAAVIISNPRINPQGLDAQFIRIMCRLLSIVAGAIVFLEGGRYLGIPISTLLASAGIGGLAVALAAQDTLKNLFGTIMLLTDKPFRVGERIIFGKYDGVVEDIGLRSTRLRLLNGHQATVPNDELARNDIENVGRRLHIRRKAKLEMPSTTPVKKVRRALEIVRQALENHEGMQESHPPRVFLRDLQESSIGIFVIYWYHPANYWQFLAFGERVNLQIMEQMEQEGIPFAAPGLTVHVSEGLEKAG